MAYSQNYEDDWSDRSYEDESDEYEREDNNYDHHYDDDDDTESDSSNDTDEETEEEDEDISDLIEEVMARRRVTPSKIPHHSKRQGVRGRARFECSNPECNGRWTSHRAHIVIDLRAQDLAKVWKQKCKECDEVTQPAFDDEELIMMIEKAIEQEKKYRNKRTENGAEGSYDDKYEPKGPPHESSLCEKCGYGEGTPCC